VEADLPQAGSLAVFTGLSFDCRQVSRLLIAHLDKEYDRLCQGDLATLEASWKLRTDLMGKRVLIECHDTQHRGRLRDLSWDRLELEVISGASIRILPEAVKHITLEEQW
jgi:hypothetical protein